MERRETEAIALAAAALAALASAPALADVRAGVEAWSRGDYAAAVREWQGPAEAGDPDALFNLAQAYRLGRGVAMDPARAEALYARAAAAGHVQAADTYGLMLFQDGRREAALPYIRDSARRGDPRAQYLLGVAHFNGDLVPRDWSRAYALVSLASAANLRQAGPALAEMDAQIPLAQRQEGARLAEDLRRAAETARINELAAAGSAAGPAVVAVSPDPANAPAPATVAASPSVAAARAAVEEASRATGTEHPGAAGTSFARPSPTQSPASVPDPIVAAAAPSSSRPPAVRVPAASASGPWRVQLGAFSVAENAQALWDRLRGRPELAGKQRIAVRTGGVTRLQAGGFATRADAEAACRALRSAGQDCLVAAN